MAETMPMPAFAPVLSLFEGGFAGVGVAVVLVTGVEVGVEVAVSVVVVDSGLVEDVEGVAGNEVGKWPFCHSILSPGVFGSRPTLGMRGAA